LLQEFIDIEGGIEIGDRMIFSPGTTIPETVTITDFYVDESFNEFVIIFEPALANIHPKGAVVLVLPEQL
jgi:hypothetical protein